MDSTTVTRPRRNTAPATPCGRRPVPTGELREGSRMRLDMLEVRAKRARRRLIITLVSLAATAATWTFVGLGTINWAWGLIPSVILAAVLVLGRAARIADKKAHDRWAAQRRRAARAAAAERAQAAGGPASPRNRAVLGVKTTQIEQPARRAVGGPIGMTSSDYFGKLSSVEPVTTDALQPVSGPASAPVSTIGWSATGVVALDSFADADDLAEAFAPVASIADDETSEQAPSVVAAVLATRHSADDEAVSQNPSDLSGTPADTNPVAEAPAVVAAAASIRPQAWAPRPVPLSEGEQWTPRDLPLPTYLQKLAAPKREQRPISAMFATVSDEVATAIDAENADASGAQPHSQSLGIPLDQILARRRAS